MNQTKQIFFLVCKKYAAQFVLGFIFCLILQHVDAQTYPGKYWLEFTDKNGTSYSVLRPEEFLSQRSIERRSKHNIPTLARDLPVNPNYLDSLRSLGITILNTSKWFNAATIESYDTALLDTLHLLSFVKKPVYEAYQKSSFKTAPWNSEKFNEKTDTTLLDYYGSSATQIEMLNLHKIHQMGFFGKNLVIAILDAGFDQVDSMPIFQHLWQNQQILGFRDFVNRSSDIFEEDDHGNLILQMMAARDTGHLMGTSPEAKFWLLRTEDVGSEYRIEEDNWISGAEFADSVGADIINSSLGYNNRFTDPFQNHTYYDIYGNTTRITIAADIAASLGMLVVNSAGNEGNSSWYFIGAPADGDSVLTIGAVDELEFIAYFSSRGPTYDNRVKPNVCALGFRVPFQNTSLSYTYGNGTSFSSPIVAGAAASLWEAFPQAHAYTIKTAIEQSADRYHNPNTAYGYGIPDFDYAYNLLKTRINNQQAAFEIFSLYPNPAEDYLYVNMRFHRSATATLYVMNSMGQIVHSLEDIWLNAGENIVPVPIPPTMASGMYHIYVVSGKETASKSFLKQ